MRGPSSSSSHPHAHQRQGGHFAEIAHAYDESTPATSWKYLMKRVPQDHGDERLVPEEEIFSGLEAAGAEVLSSSQARLVPDFAPRPLLGAFVALDRLVETVPLARCFCAHNVVVARRPLLR